MWELTLPMVHLHSQGDCISVLADREPWLGELEIGQKHLIAQMLRFHKQRETIFPAVKETPIKMSRY